MSALTLLTLNMTTLNAKKMTMVHSVNGLKKTKQLTNFCFCVEIEIFLIPSKRKI